MQLNSIKPAIQFTRKRETANTLLFLNVSIKRQPDRLNLSVQETYHTSWYLQFDSYHPNSHTSSAVSALLPRARAVCSTEAGRKKEEEAVIADLKTTTNFIRCVECRLHRSGSNHRSSTLLMPPSARRATCTSLPRVKGTSETSARTVRKEGMLVAHTPVPTPGRPMPRSTERPPEEGAHGAADKTPRS